MLMIKTNIIRNCAWQFQSLIASHAYEKITLNIPMMSVGKNAIVCWQPDFIIFFIISTTTTSCAKDIVGNVVIPIDFS